MSGVRITFYKLMLLASQYWVVRVQSGLKTSVLIIGDKVKVTITIIIAGDCACTCSCWNSWLTTQNVSVCWRKSIQLWATFLSTKLLQTCMRPRTRGPEFWMAYAIHNDKIFFLTTRITQIDKRTFLSISPQLSHLLLLWVHSTPPWVKCGQQVTGWHHTWSFLMVPPYGSVLVANRLAA